MVNIQPFGDRIVVKVLVTEEATTGGLLLAPVSIENSNKGEVIAVGEGISLPDGTIKPLTIKIKDIVVFNKGAGTDYKTSEGLYKILSYRDVLGKVVKEV